MKKLNSLSTLAALCLFFTSFTALAANPPLKVTITCKAKSTPSYFKAFQVTIDEPKVSFLGTETRSLKTRTPTKAVTDGIGFPNTEKLVVAEFNADERGDGMKLYRMKADFIIGDYANVSFDLRRDDDGLAGLLEIASDGPHTVTFYRCTEQ